MSRRNTKTPPRTSTLCTVIESLEPRAMLAGVGPESWSAPGLAPAPLGTGALFSSGVILTCSSPTLGSSGTSSPPAPTSGSGGTTSGGDLWDSFSTGSGAGGSTSGSAGGLSTNGPALSSQYNGGSGAGNSSGTSSGSGTTSGSDLWDFFSVKPGTGGSTSGSTGGVSTDGPALSSQYTGGSSAGGQGNGTGNTLSNADLWGMYWSGAGAGSSSGPANGSRANAPTLSAKYTGGSGGGMVFFVTGATRADAASSGSQQVSTGSTTLTLADGQSPVMTTPLVYQPGSDDGPGVVSGVWTGGVGEVQFVLAADQDGDLTGRPLSIGKPGQPVLIVSGAGPNSYVVFDGSDLPPYTGPGIQSVAPPRTLGEFLYDAFVADTVTVYGNTVHLAPNPRGYTVVGFFFANLVGVRGVSDAFSDHDAADAHEQSGAERAIDGVFGTIGLVCTALPLAKPAASVISGPGAKAAGTLLKGIGKNQLAEITVIIRNGTTHIGDDVVFQGSRVSGAANELSDLDIAVRVSAEDFAELIAKRFGTPNPGSAKESTMLHAIETGKIQAGEAGLSGLRKQIQRIIGVDVDISVIQRGGNFDNGPTLPVGGN